MTTPDLVWGSLLLAGAAFEAYTLGTKRQGDTLSESTRRWFRIRSSKTGRWVFGIAWTAFAVWFYGHILNWWW